MILLHYQRDERVEQSVNRMMTIIDLARNIRERHNKALKTPLKYVQAPLIFCMCIFSMMMCVVLHLVAFSCHIASNLCFQGDGGCASRQ